MALSWVELSNDGFPSKEYHRVLFERLCQSFGFRRALDSIRLNATKNLSNMTTVEEALGRFFSLIDFAEDMASMEYNEIYEEMSENAKHTMSDYSRYLDKLTIRNEVTNEKENHHGV